MWKQTVELPTRWLTAEQCLALLGIPEGKFRQLVAKGLIESEGKGPGTRFDGEDVAAVARLYKRLAPLLGREIDDPAEG